MLEAESFTSSESNFPLGRSEIVQNYLNSKKAAIDAMRNWCLISKLSENDEKREMLKALEDTVTILSKGELRAQEARICSLKTENKTANVSELQTANTIEGLIVTCRLDDQFDTASFILDAGKSSMLFESLTDAEKRHMIQRIASTRNNSEVAIVFEKDQEFTVEMMSSSVHN